LNPGLITAFRRRGETRGKPLAVAARLKVYVLSLSQRRESLRQDLSRKNLLARC
jgi:hypothetical protein